MSESNGRNPLDVHREESAERWSSHRGEHSEHRRDHEMLDAELTARDREVNDKILAAMSTLMRHEEQMKSGVGSFAEVRGDIAAIRGDLESLKPSRKSWKQLAAGAAGFVVAVASAGWIAAVTIGARPTFDKTKELIEERARIPHPETSTAIERVAVQLSDVKQEQAEQRQQVRDVKDDVREIKTDIKEALRRR
jgi:hypothetical protein